MSKICAFALISLVQAGERQLHSPVVAAPLCASALKFPEGKRLKADRLLGFQQLTQCLPFPDTCYAPVTLLAILYLIEIDLCVRIVFILTTTLQGRYYDFSICNEGTTEA